jgi:hypothetical protein
VGHAGGIDGETEGIDSIGHMLSSFVGSGPESVSLAMGAGLLSHQACPRLVAEWGVLLLGYGRYFGYAGVRYHST